MQVIRITILFTLSLYSVFISNAQNSGDHYLYSDFENAVVCFKNGHKEGISLNYNTVTEEMVFVRNSQYLALDNIETIDSVLINEDLFIPYNNFFLKLQSADPVMVLVRYKNRILNTGKSTGYGTSQTNAIDNYSSIISSGQIYDLNISAEYKLTTENSIFVKNEQGFHKADNIRDLSRLFSVPGKEVRKYIKEKDLNPEDVGDLTTLIIFLGKQ